MNCETDGGRSCVYSTINVLNNNPTLFCGRPPPTRGLGRNAKLSTTNYWVLCPNFFLSPKWFTMISFSLVEVIVWLLLFIDIHPHHFLICWTGRLVTDLVEEVEAGEACDRDRQAVYQFDKEKNLLAHALSPRQRRRQWDLFVLHIIARLLL